MTVAYWVCALVTLASALTSLGFSLKALTSTHNKSRTNAMYAAVRSAALAFAAVVPLFMESRSWLEAIAIAMIFVQSLDTVIGLKMRDALKTYGPAATALTNLAVLVWLMS
ncbi:MAG: hypothetical protein ACR2KG_01800 [Nocardioidaceae bacterium]